MQKLVHTGNAITIFYLMLGTNFLGPLLSCELQYVLSTNMWLKHIIGFAMLYFLLIATSVIPDAHPNTQLLVTVAVYLTFLLTTKCDYSVLFMILCLLIALTYMQNLRDYPETKPPTNRTIEIIQQVIVAMIIVLLLVGFFMYIGEKMRHRGFNIKDFILGKPVCIESTNIDLNINTLKEAEDAFLNGVLKVVPK